MKRSMTHLVLFVIMETIFITTIAKIYLLYLTMLTILFTNHGVRVFYR